MVAVQQGKVLVTGANGFVAMWVVKRLLEEGYSVRGTVRSESKAKHVREFFAKYGDKLEVVIVEDITKVRYSVVRICAAPSSLTGLIAFAARRLRRLCEGCRRYRAHRIPLPLPSE